jgi:hypothetical protein
MSLAAGASRVTASIKLLAQRRDPRRRMGLIVAFRAMTEILMRHEKGVVITHVAALVRGRCCAAQRCGWKENRLSIPKIETA